MKTKTNTTPTAVAKRKAETALAPRPEPRAQEMDVKSAAEAFAKSGFFADATDAAKAVVKILAGRELGLGAMASMTGIVMVKGRPTLSANTMLAVMLGSRRYKHKVLKHDNAACSIEFLRREGEGWESVGTSTFTMEDAKLAGLSSGDNYRKYPRNMLFARAVSNGCKWFCLAGDTQVVTRDGIKSIAELAGTSPELLVPVKDPSGRLGEIGKFVKAPVFHGGLQNLWDIKLRLRNQEIVVRATPEHRWFVPRSPETESGSDEKTTRDLQAGDKLRSLRAAPMTRGKPKELSPIGIMQGFVFGDGNRGTDGKPTTLEIQKGKDEALLPYFAVCNPKPYRMSKGNDVWRVFRLPRSWKRLPDIRESKSFLLGWLAGWFAADGTVDERGYASLSCVNKQHLEFAAGVAAILGIRYGKVGEQLGSGFSCLKPQYRLSFFSRDLPSSFFVLEHHRERVLAMTETRCEHYWTVVSVEPKLGVDHVYCAIVDGVGAFGLAGGLMTGNCPDSFCGITPYTPDEVEPAAVMTEEGDYVLQAEVVRPEPEAEVVGEGATTLDWVRHLVKETNTDERKLAAHLGVRTLAELNSPGLANAARLLQAKLKNL